MCTVFAHTVCVFGSAKDFPFTFYTLSKPTSLLLNEGSPPHCFFGPWHRWLGVSHWWSSYMIKYICWAKRLQMKIFIFGFTYVPKVKGQPCLHFSSEHIFSILYHLSIRVLVKLFTSLYLKHPPAPFLFYGMSPASPSFYLWISPLFFWQPVLLLISQSFFFNLPCACSAQSIEKEQWIFFFFSSKYWDFLP